MSALSITASPSRPGGDVSRATEVSLPANTQEAHAGADRWSGSIGSRQRSGSTIRRKPMSAAALAVVWRLGRTRCVCTSTTGPSAAKHSSAAAGSTSASAGMSKNPPPCSASRARSGGGRADPVAQVLGRRQVEAGCVPVGQVDRAVQRPLLPRPGRHRCVLVGGPGRQQRDVDAREPSEPPLRHPSLHGFDDQVLRGSRITTRGNPPSTESVSAAFLKPAPRRACGCRRRPS